MRPTPPTSPRQLSILMFEDNPFDAKLAASSMQEQGLDAKLQVTELLPEFERLLANEGLDVIVSDFRLPTASGLDALRVAKEKRPDLPFIFFSGTVGEEFAVDALRRGASDFVVKAHMKRLAPAILRALEEKGAQKRSRVAELLQQRLSAILDATSDFVGFGHSNGALTWINPAGMRMIGLSPERDISTLSIAGLHPDWAAQTIIREGLPTAERDGFWRGITALLDQAGAEIPVSQVIQCHRDAAGQVEFFSTIMRDITGLKKAQSEIEALASRHRLLFDRNPESMWVFDLATFEILDVNEAAIRRYGYSREEFLALTILDLRPAEDVGRAVEETESLRGISPGEESIRFSGIWRHMTSNGDVFPVEIMSDRIDFDGRDARIVLARDITERVRAEGAVRDQIRRLSILSQINRSIAERRDAESIFRVVTERLAADFQADVAVVLLVDGKNEALIVADQSCAAGFAAKADSLAVGSRIPLAESKMARCLQGQTVYNPDTRKDDNGQGSERLAGAGIESYIAAALVVDQRPAGVLFAGRRQPNAFSSGESEFLRQLGEHVAFAMNQIRLVEELQRTMRGAMEQERLRAMGQMASGIAHDINNSLAPITMYSGLMLEIEPSLSEESRHLLRTIITASEDISRTTQRLAQFYRRRDPASEEMARLDLSEVATQVIDLTRPRWHDMPLKRGVAIKIRSVHAEEPAEVLAYAHEIRECLTNLVFNATDSMPKGGTITLGTRVEGERVIAEVADTGVGMDEDTHRRCLEPFFTTKGEKGTGLGLSMVFGIMKAHGGALEIESAPGVGTTMRLVFPAIRRAPVEEPAAPLDVAAPGGPSLRVLCIDDEPLVREILRRALERDGHAVDLAEDGSAGLDAFAAAHASGRPFDLVITDLGMPHMDGEEVARRIKAISAATPIILLSGWGARLNEEGESPAHVDRVLSKPMSITELRAAIASLAR